MKDEFSSWEEWPEERAVWVGIGLIIGITALLAYFFWARFCAL